MKHKEVITNNSSRPRRIFKDVNLMNVYEKWMEKKNGLMKAIDSYEKRIENDPRDGEAWYRKGKALSRLSINEEAIECFNRAININPNNHKAWYQKAVIYEETIFLDRLLECCDKATKINPQYEKARELKGKMLAEHERYGEAIECFTEVKRINPNNVRILCEKEVLLKENAEPLANRRPYWDLLIDISELIMKKMTKTS